MNSLVKYLKAFEKLKRGVTKYGKAPQKVVMLLSVLQAVSNKLITENEIFITPELVFHFKANWHVLVTTNHACNFALPFWHLRGDRFWFLIPKAGFEASLLFKESVSSLGELNATIDYAKLNDDLFVLMLDEKSNLMLQQFLLDEYFQETKSIYNQTPYKQVDLFDDLEGKILSEDAGTYRAEIKELLAQNNEEEIFLRGSLFKREIPKIYNNTCCISGMKIDATINVSMVDACHIIPFSESYNDTITNGIALCPNLHRAFDRGLIAIGSNYKVVVSTTFKEEESNYSIHRFEGKEILLPRLKNYFPLKENFSWHQTNIFK